MELLTREALVLGVLANDPDVRIRDVADFIGVTERTAWSMIHALADGGFVRIEPHGRRSRYTVAADMKAHITDLMSASLNANTLARKAKGDG